MTNKKYLVINVARGYPVGDSVFYECLVCGGTMPSIPKHAVVCKCRNVIVDVDAGRVSVKDISNFKAYNAT